MVTDSAVSELFHWLQNIKSSFWIGSSNSLHRLSLTPITFWKSTAAMPWGWLTLTLIFASVRTVPSGKSSAATKLFLNFWWQSCSLSTNFLFPSPKAFSTVLISVTKDLNSAGSKEQAWSLPFWLLSSVICLSITWNRIFKIVLEFFHYLVRFSSNFPKLPLNFQKLIQNYPKNFRKILQTSSKISAVFPIRRPLGTAKIPGRQTFVLRFEYTLALAASPWFCRRVSSARSIR